MALLSPGFRSNAWQAGLAFLDRLPAAHRLGSLPSHLRTGKQGEAAAFFYLRELGLIVVARGWQNRKAPGDIDLVAWDGDTLCFVEVKTRSSREVASAESAVDAMKRRSLRRLAWHYRRQVLEECPTRFDVLSVYLLAGKAARDAEFEHFRNAFGWEE